MERDGERRRDPTDHGPVALGAPSRRQRPRSYRYLLDLDVDLAEELDVRMRLAARPAVTAITFEVEPGDVRLAEWLARRRPVPGCSILDGVVARQRPASAAAPPPSWSAPAICSSRGRATTRSCWCATIGWRALVPRASPCSTRDFAQRVQPWPQITRGAAAACRATHPPAERPAGDRRPAASRGAPGAAAVAPGRALGQGRAGRDPAAASAHPPAAGAAGRRRAPVGVARAGAPVAGRPGHAATATNGTCTAASRISSRR